MNHYPTESELLEMSLAHFEMHAKELLGSDLTEEQRRELARLGKELAGHESV